MMAEEKQKLSGGMKVAVYVITLIFLYLGGITFVPAVHVNEKQANSIAPSFSNVLMLLMGYYWGSSSKNKDPLFSGIPQIDKEAQDKAAELEFQRIIAARLAAKKEEEERLKLAEEEAAKVIQTAEDKSNEKIV
jgi:DICT domain-containing protein